MGQTKTTKHEYEQKNECINNIEEVLKKQQEYYLTKFWEGFKQHKIMLKELSEEKNKEETKIENLKIYPKNLNKKVVTLCTITTIIITSMTGCQFQKKCTINEEHSHIFKNETDIEYMYEDCGYEQENYHQTNNYILEDELGNYLKENNLYKISEIKEDIMTKINKKEDFTQSKKAFTYIKKNGEVGFKTKWKLLSEDQEQEYIGIVREGTKENLKYKIYKVEKEETKYKKTSSIVETLEEQDDYYIDIEDFVVLENQEQNYYIEGKVRTKK